VLEGFGLVLGEVAGFDQLVHQRLIFGDLLELAIAQQVAPAIAHLAQEQHFVDQHGRRGGGAHAAARSFFLRRLEDPPPSLFDGLHEPARQRVAVLGARAPAHRLDEDIDGHLARDLAGGRAAHAVANREQHAALADLVFEALVARADLARRKVGDHEVVFVVLADLTDGGATGIAHGQLTAGDVVTGRGRVVRLICAVQAVRAVD
jgi:hypothetical protein